MRQGEGWRNPWVTHRVPSSCESVGTVQGSKSPKSGKEGFGVKKLPFPIASEKGALSRKIPIFLVEPCREMGLFRLKAPFSEAKGNASFLTPKPSFPDFGDFDPCTVPTLSQLEGTNIPIYLSGSASSQP